MVNEMQKHDKGKVRLELIHPSFVFALGSALTFGAQKYAAHNWMMGTSWTRVFGALLRHLYAWVGGAGPTSRNFAFGDTDAETAFSHLWHASACIHFLVCYEDLKLGTDDRWAVGAPEPKENDNDG